jgi:DNA-binding transcriptional LysR family regulator
MITLTPREVSPLGGAHGLPTLDQLDLNLFRVFDVVYRERNLSRAAAVLALTQSAVSHALARLREQLGDPLFVRQGRGVVPTELAVQLAPSVSGALLGLQQALASRRDFLPARDLGRLTVALPGELELLILPEWIARLRQQAPQAVLATTYVDRSELRRDLSAGRLDVALDVAAQPADPDVAHEQVVEDRLCVVADPRRRRLNRQAYLAARHVAVSTRRARLAPEDVRLSAEGVQRQVVIRCQSYETACHLVAGSDLLLTMPRRLAELRRRQVPLRIFEPPLRMAPIHIHLYWLREREDSPACRWLRCEVKRLFDDLG